LKFKDLIFAALIIFCSWYFQPKGNTVFNHHTSEIIKRDTVYHTHTSSFEVITPQPQVVYVDTGNNNTVVIDTTKGIKLNSYTDSLVNDDISIYYTDLVNGTLIDKQLKYTLRVPEIITTKKIYPKQHSFYLTGEVGGNKETFNNISLGLLYTSPTSYSFNYRYNIIQNSHNIGGGLKLFRNKNGIY
jgi:hypothetical protein